MTRLEKEVQEAKNARKAELKSDGNGKHGIAEHENDTSDNLDLGSVLIKRSSKLEKEIEEAKRNQKSFDTDKHSSNRQLKQEDGAVPSLDKILVKHVTKLEREVREAKNGVKDSYMPKENIDLNKMRRNEKENDSLESILVKPLNRLEREKMRSSLEKDTEKWRYNKKEHGKPIENQCESLDKCLIKHVSRLEKEKMEVNKESFEVKEKETPKDSTLGGLESLDQILLKQKPKIDKATLVVTEQPEAGNKCATLSRREARERELLESWGGIDLGGAMRPHVSRLQRDKAAWSKAEEERHAVLQAQQQKSCRSSSKH